MQTKKKLCEVYYIKKNIKKKLIFLIKKQKKNMKILTTEVSKLFFASNQIINTELV